MSKVRAPRNRTLVVNDFEKEVYKKSIVYPSNSLLLEDILNKTVCADIFTILDILPKACVDLLILDPPYNLDKNFNGFSFSKRSDASYIEYLESWFPKLLRTVKPSASVYLCGDWKNSVCLYTVMQKYMKVQNRIIWQREKGRGAKNNWKNVCEDIWFGTMSSEYYFDVGSVKQKKRVLAPYKEHGKPKDWQESKEGKFRLTYPSNFWEDISIPYWSMPENTDHPTQKPEKLIAKLLLASSAEGGVVLDPFLGSGTTSVVAKKLGRNYIGIEMNEEYCFLAEKRICSAKYGMPIQGYAAGVFWERNIPYATRKKNI